MRVMKGNSVTVIAKRKFEHCEKELHRKIRGLVTSPWNAKVAREASESPSFFKLNDSSNLMKTH